MSKTQLQITILRKRRRIYSLSSQLWLLHYRLSNSGGICVFSIFSSLRLFKNFKPASNAVTWLCWELQHPHGQGDTPTLSSAAGRFLKYRCLYSNPHFSKATTQKCYLKSHPLFMPRTTQRQISVHSLQSQTLKGHCCSTSSQYTTTTPPTQPGWISLWLSNPLGTHTSTANPRHRKTLSHFCLQQQNISALSCFTASEKGKLLPMSFSPKSNILI